MYALPLPWCTRAACSAAAGGARGTWPTPDVDAVGGADPNTTAACKSTATAAPSSPVSEAVRVGVVAQSGRRKDMCVCV